MHDPTALASFRKAHDPWTLLFLLTISFLIFFETPFSSLSPAHAGSRFDPSWLWPPLSATSKRRDEQAAPLPSATSSWLRPPPSATSSCPRPPPSVTSSGATAERDKQTAPLPSATSSWPRPPPRATSSLLLLLHHRTTQQPQQSISAGSRRRRRHGRADGAEDGRRRHGRAGGASAQAGLDEQTHGRRRPHGWSSERGRVESPRQAPSQAGLAEQPPPPLHVRRNRHCVDARARAPYEDSATAPPAR